MAQERQAFFFRQRRQCETFVHAVTEVRNRIHHRTEFGLRKDDDLQQLFGVGFKVEQHPQDFKGFWGEFLPFVDQEHQLPLFFEGELQYFAFNLVDGFGGVFPVPVDPKMRAEGFQKT